MSASSSHDPYRLSSDDIEAAPVTASGIARKIGPGLILAGMIVGSGELIATTVLGAENSYTLLWLILISCVVKIVVQNELGRYTIGTGETSLEAFNRVPGPRLGVSWVVWVWFLGQIFVQFGIGGMLGAIAEVLDKLIPGFPLWMWVLAVNGLTVVLLAVGSYRFVEKFSMVLVVSFTVMTVASAGLLLDRPEYFSWGKVLDGLSFHMPRGGFMTTVAVFGITGVGASELASYSYWCVEKGYARFTGPYEETSAWQGRALGWIRVMGVDVVNAMVIYTFTTVAFYFLGAGVLHGMGVMPEGSQMVETLSNMYTETLGPRSRPVFLIGAAAIFYSTVFAGVASRSRMTADMMVLLGAYDRADWRKRLFYTRWLVVLYLAVPTAFFFLVQEPVVMVKIAGLTEAAMLPVVGFATIYLRYRHLPKSIAPRGWITLALWLTTFIMLVMTGVSVADRLFGLGG